MANETLATILQNQNTYIANGEAARQTLDTKVTNAMSALTNDDTALTNINTKVTNATNQLVNDDTALSSIDTKVTNATNQLVNDDTALTNIKDSVEESLASLIALANRTYNYTHEAIVTDGLENDYDLIINGGYQRLYNPPSDWAENYNSYYYLNNNVYQLNNSITWDWSKEYYKYFTPNTDLTNVSAVGILAVLKPGVYTVVSTQPDDWSSNYSKYSYLSNGEYLFNTSPEWDTNKQYYIYSGDTVRPQGNRLFINGKESDGYTYQGINSAEGIEFVKIWFFNENINISDVNFDKIKLNIKARKSITIPEDIFNTYEVIIEGDIPVPKTASASKISFLNNYLGTIPATTHTVTSNITELPYNNAFVRSNSTVPTGLTTVILPELTIIKGNAPNNQYYNGFYRQINLKNFIFPKLDRIENGASDYSQRAFAGVPDVTLPPTVTYVGSRTFIGNTNLTLLCGGEDTTFNDNWYGNNSEFQSQGILNLAPNYPTTVTLADNWKTSINLARAAFNLNYTKFIEIIDNKLDYVGFVASSDNNGNADYDSQTDKYIRNTEGTGAFNTSKYITVPYAKLGSIPQTKLDDAFNLGFDIRGA